MKAASTKMIKAGMLLTSGRLETKAQIKSNIVMPKS